MPPKPRQLTANSTHTQQPEPASATSVLKVLTYLPNLICYTRLLLVLAAELALATLAQPHAALALYILSFVLDAADGEAARRLKQQTAFGAFLDVAVDNLSRAALWSRAFPGLPGVLLPTLESICFVCAHKAGGDGWKEGCFKDAPAWIQAVMARNFRSPWGALAVAGLMGLPLWCWANKVLPGHPLCSPALGALLLVGRALAAAVELWLVRRYLESLIRSEARPST